jgi:hypothetical protein
MRARVALLGKRTEAASVPLTFDARGGTALAGSTTSRYTEPR